MSAADLGQTEGTNTSQSSGSQDSIDQLNRIFDKNTFTDERGYSEGLRDDLLAEVWAWHNTQLKEAYTQGYDDCLKEHGAVFEEED